MTHTKTHLLRASCSEHERFTQGCTWCQEATIDHYDAIAPDLLQALKEIAARDNRGWAGYDPNAVAYEIAGIARAAIKKAESQG